MNKIKFNLIMEVIALRLMGFSKWEIRGNSKIYSKLSGIALELAKEI